MNKARGGLVTGRTLTVCENSHPFLLHLAGDCPVCAKLDYIERLRAGEKALLDEITTLKEKDERLVMAMRGLLGMEEAIIIEEDIAEHKRRREIARKALGDEAKADEHG